MRAGQVRVTGNFQLRYRAYARDHGMSPEQMLSHDRGCCPDSLLKPYFLWLSRKWYEWGRLAPEQPFHGIKEEAAFERWLDQLIPASDAVTCECHLKLIRPRHRR